MWAGILRGAGRYMQSCHVTLVSLAVHTATTAGTCIVTGQQGMSQDNHMHEAIPILLLPGP